MSGEIPLPDRDRLQSWVNSVPPASLDQPEDPPCKEDPAFIPIPASQTDLTHDSLQQAQQPNTPTQPHPLPASSLADPVLRSDGAASSQARAGAGASAPSASVDSLWQLQNATIVANSQVPLPESGATSVATIRSDNRLPATSVNSLLQLQSAGIPAEPQVPLPDLLAPRPSEDPNKDYWTSIKPLLDCLPHLQAVTESNGRHRNKGSVRCIDYVRGHVQPNVHNTLRPGKNFKESVRKLRHVTEPEVTTRFIMVEDLSPEIIDCVGSTFEVDPELFAEHLNRSGYRGMDYEDPLLDHWSSNASISLKWYRPVKQNPKVTQWMRIPGNLIDMKEITNKTNDETELVPASITWDDPGFRPDGHPNEDASRHYAVISTNIFRHSWTLSTRSGTRTETFKTTLGRSMSSSRGKIYRRATPATDALDLDWEYNAIPTAWEEKASFFRCSYGTVPIVLLLLDPLPSISDFQTPLDSKGKKKVRNRGIAPETRRETKIHMALPIRPRLPLRFPKNKFEASVEDIQSLKNATHHLISTKTAMRLQSGTVPDWGAFRADPILGLLRVVQLDSKAFFSSLEWALHEISQDSLDDYLISRRLEDWRKLMSDFEIEVPAIGKSLHDFAAFVFDDGTGTNVPKEIQLIIDDVNADIARIKSGLDEAYRDLRADMQFAESRRSINEAKTVTKLTELAFIFIPLSFSASLFSMSITELSNGVPVWTFIVTSLGMTIFAYGVRLILTSDFVAESSRGALERFWALRGVERGSNAPVFTIVRFTILEIWQNGGAKLLGNASLVLFCGSLLVVPVAFAWTSTNLDIGFHVAVSLFLVLSSVALALGFFFGVGAGGEYMTTWGREGDSSGEESGEDV